MHAGLTSLEKHGPALLRGTSPLLRDGLLAIVKELSQETDMHLLSRDVLFHITDAALGAVAAHPELMVYGVRQEWLKELIGSVLRTVGDQGIRSTFSKKGLEAIIRDTAGSMAENPGLIVQKPGLFHALVGGVLRAIEDADALDADSIATAATAASLKVLVQDPTLLDSRFPELVADCARRLALLVASKKISRIQAADIIAVAVNAVLLNPVLFGKIYENLAGEVIGLVVEAVQKHGNELIAGALLVEVIRQVLGAVAAYGLPLLAAGSFESFLDKVSGVLIAGIAITGEELGKSLNLSSLPVVLAGLTLALARGDITVIDPNDSHFIALFEGLAASAKA